MESGADTGAGVTKIMKLSKTHVIYLLQMYVKKHFTLRDIKNCSSVL